MKLKTKVSQGAVEERYSRLQSALALFIARAVHGAPVLVQERHHGSITYSERPMLFTFETNAEAVVWRSARIVNQYNPFIEHDEQRHRELEVSKDSLQ